MSYTLAAFERFCLELRTENGEPLVLESFQKRILRDHFRGVEEEVVVLPKKNGKSTVFSALGLFHLENWIEEDPEAVIGASSRDQATILYNQAGDMVERSPGMEDRFDVRRGYRLIRLRSNPNARLRVLAADANTADGVIPTLALVDELHRHPSGDLYGVFRDGLDGRNGRMVTMSTAGLKEDSALGELRKRAEKLDSYKRKGAYVHAETEGFVLHEWSLTEEDDRNDLELVKAANPASWQTVEKLRKRKLSPSMTPGRWARFACGVWTNAEEPWITGETWDSLEVELGEVQDGEKVWLAIDVGTNPGIGLAAPRENEGAAVKAWLYPGEPNLEYLEEELIALAGRYDVAEILFDRVGFQRSAELLEARGLPMVERAHSPEHLSIVSQTLHRLINTEKLWHGDEPELRTQVVEAITKETERGWRLVKSPESRALIATAVAVHWATQVVQPPRKPKIYTLEVAS